VVVWLQPLHTRALRDDVLVQRERDRDGPEDRGVLEDEHEHRLRDAHAVWRAVERSCARVVATLHTLCGGRVDVGHDVGDGGEQVRHGEVDDQLQEEDARGAHEKPIENDEKRAEHGQDGGTQRSGDDCISRHDVSLGKDAPQQAVVGVQSREQSGGARLAGRGARCREAVGQEGVGERSRESRCRGWRRGTDGRGGKLGAS